MRAVVIGGGLGGLAVAVRLAAAGWDVTVCEQGERFGGKMNRWEKDGFRFDTGPSLITLPGVFEELYRAAGERLSDHVDLVPLDPLIEHVFDDGVRFFSTSSLPEWTETVRRIEPDDVEGFYRFLRLGARLYELSRLTFLSHPVRDWPRVSPLSVLRHIPLRHGWGSYARTVEAHVRSTYLRRMLFRYPTYVGSSPYASPATLAIIPYIETAFGGWYARGGLYGIVESLVGIADRRGVSLRAGCRVTRIERLGGRVRGVACEDGRVIPSDIVVMNGDASALAALLDPWSADGPFDLPEDERSLSGVVFLLGLRRSRPDLSHHAVHFGDDYRKEFAELFDRRRFPDDPTVYVNVPSRTDRSVVDGEGETVFVMANAPAVGERDWGDAEIAEARRRIFARLRRGGFPDIEGEIAVEDVWTPARFARDYAMPGGAIYGAHSHGWRRAFLRPANRVTGIAGLYRVGGSAHPGGGTPTVLHSARITAELIRRHECA